MNYRHEKMLKASCGCHCVEGCVVVRCLQMRKRSDEVFSACEITHFILVVNQQGDNKKMEDAKCYLTLPCTKMEMEEKEAPSGKNLHHLANFTPSKDSTKDSFQIATLICSTKLTQNGRSWHHWDTNTCFIFEIKKVISADFLVLQHMWAYCFTFDLAASYINDSSIPASVLPIQTTEMFLQSLVIYRGYFI